MTVAIKGQFLPVDGDWPLFRGDFHTVDCIFNIFGSPPSQSTGAEGDTGEPEGGKNEAHVGAQALQVLLVVGGLELVMAFSLAPWRLFHDEDD